MARVTSVVELQATHFVEVVLPRFVGFVESEASLWVADNHSGLSRPYVVDGEDDGP